IAAGLAAMLASFAAVPAVHGVAAITVTVAAFQIALNAILAPLMALVAEEVPPARTAMTTGLFAVGPPLAALVTLALALPALRTFGARLVVVAAISTICLLPLLTTRPRPVAERVIAVPSAIARPDLALALVARLLVQIAGNVLFADLLYLTEQPGGVGGIAIARTSALLLLGNLLPLPIAVAIGRRSARRARLRPFLVTAAAAAAIGLAVMAASSGWNGRAVGFLLFATGWGVFLPLQVGYVMQLLPDPDHRGRDLAVLNLANTLPVLIGQGLAWWLATPRDAAALLLALAALTLAGGALMSTVGARGRPLSRSTRSRSP
ncbi:MFS transporter, partial [Sphingomonas bacterium]|uniref:MFS transporter n=1 Tax=Sphingomonas bacterium TaxID=1895847 RepID=UPI00157513D0